MEDRKETTKTNIENAVNRILDINRVYVKQMSNGTDIKVSAKRLQEAMEMFANIDSGVLLEHIREENVSMLAHTIQTTVGIKERYTLDELVDFASHSAQFIGMTYFFEGYFFREVQSESLVSK